MAELQCPQCYSPNMRRHSFTVAGKQRFSCKDCGFRTVSPLGIEQFDQTIDHTSVSQKLKSLKKFKRYVVTSAQNATPVHTGFFKALELYCAENNAELIVIPYRYKNPTSVFTDKDYEWWAPEVTPHLVDKRYDLCEGLTLLADVKIQPTARVPLTGLDGFTGEKSCIVGHPQYQFKTTATRQGGLAKLMTTTGSITVPNYTRSKAGKIGAHNHQLAATVVELDGGLFHVRQLTANHDGTFTDLKNTYMPSMPFSVEAERPSSIVLGDLHQWWVSPKVDHALFGPDGLVTTMDPLHVFIHDAIDTYSVNHHHRGDPFIKYAKHKFGYASIAEEVHDLVDYIDARLIDDVDFHFVSSNHDDHIARYIKETDWRSDPENAEFYLETAHHMITETKMVEGGSSTPSPFEYWMNKLLPEVDVIGRESSFELNGVEHGYHGDIGPNGARGSNKNLSKIGVKLTCGHAHSPAATEGCYTVGTSTGRMGYAAAGPSGWLNTHCLQYADGKRTFIHTIDGRWKT